VNKFVHDENIKLFHKRLAETADPEKRRVLLKLLAEEEANGEYTPMTNDETIALRATVIGGQR
jgi:hypothetical protein